MTTSRIICLDIGLKRTGVAVSDETRTIASPRGTIDSTDRKRWLQQIQQLVTETEASAILVGVPLNQYGDEGADATTIRRFIAVLRESISIPVIEWDERYSTVQAERMLIAADVSRKKRKGVIDQVAAAIILQSYLDSLTFDRNA